MNFFEYHTATFDKFLDQLANPGDSREDTHPADYPEVIETRPYWTEMDEAEKVDYAYDYVMKRNKAGTLRNLVMEALTEPNLLDYIGKQMLADGEQGFVW